MPQMIMDQEILFFEQALPRCEVCVGRYRAQLLGWGRIRPQQWFGQNHSHSFFELCCVCRGAGAYVFPGGCHAPSAGDLLIAYPGEEHSLQTDPQDPLLLYCASFVLEVDAGLSSGGSPGDDSLTALAEQFLHSSRRVADTAGMETVCRLVSEEVLRREPGYELCLQGLFTKLIIALLHRMCGGAAGASGVSGASGAKPHGQSQERPQEQRLRQAVSYVEGNYHAPLRVKDIADRMFLSQRQANRMFQKSFGMPVMRYIQNFRLTMARQMLDTTARPIKEIAWACGYPNERNFMTLFRKQTGQTANEYRRRNRNENSRR